MFDTWIQCQPQPLNMTWQINGAASCENDMCGFEAILKMWIFDVPIFWIMFVCIPNHFLVLLLALRSLSVCSQFGHHKFVQETKNPQRRKWKTRLCGLDWPGLVDVPANSSLAPIFLCKFIKKDYARLVSRQRSCVRYQSSHERKITVASKKPRPSLYIYRWFIKYNTIVPRKV